MHPSLHAALAATCLLASVPAARAAGTSSVGLSPVCVTKAGAVAFFLESTDDCAGAARTCRGSRWAWATFKPGAWEFEVLGEAALDDGASPESNAQASRQLFKLPSSQACASYVRAPRVREPDLTDSEAWFQYSLEKGELVLHWQGQRTLVSPEAKLWRAAWGAEKSPRAEARPLDSAALANAVPAISLALGSEVLLGFPEPAGTGERGFLLIQVPQTPLRRAQAGLLHEDAKKIQEKAAGDLFASSKAAGLLDAALQLAPENEAARLDYARLLARQGEAAAAARELEHLKAVKGLRGTIESDPAFASVRSKDPIKRLLQALLR